MRAVSLLACVLLLGLATCSLTPLHAAKTFPFDPSAPPPNPNPPSAEEVRERNARRFPGEWLPEGYDVGEAATSGTASSETLWMSPAGLRAASEPRVWYDHPVGTPRPPGRLLLNMLVRNEAENLARTLPQWSKVIDYWIIGVDEKNDDDSIDIIKRILGHLPGEIALVRGFDGHGPTWTTLVDLGVAHFPGATHGIIADADFRPMRDHLDRMELDVRCSKHMYTIWTEDHRNERKMDWIYRNIPGAKIKRRTHQVVEVPPFPEQEVYQTLVNLPLDERAGGFGDRSGNKEERYIAWMAADLLDFPDDPRALYYLGYGHLDLFNAKGGMGGGAAARDALTKAVEYFDRRADLPPDVGNKEERWFALLKLAEIHERYLQQWGAAERYYSRCVELDGVRADPHFYLGQHYRLVGRPDLAEPHLSRAATLLPPQRSLFMWYYLYDCLSKLEYGRNFMLMQQQQQQSGGSKSKSTPSFKLLKKTHGILLSAKCESVEGNADEVRRMISTLSSQLTERREERKARKNKLKERQAKEEERRRRRKEQEQAEEEEEQEEVQQEERTTEESVDEEVVEQVAAEVTAPSLVRPASPASLSPDAARALLRSDPKVPLVRSLLRASLPLADALEQSARALLDSSSSSSSSSQAAEAEAATDAHDFLVSASKKLADYLAAYERRADSDNPEVSQAQFVTCRRFRRATTTLLRLHEQQKERFMRALSSATQQSEWSRLTDELKTVCR